MVAVTMREPRNANEKVASLAGASPNQESLEQYLRCGRQRRSRIPRAQVLT